MTGKKPILSDLAMVAQNLASPTPTIADLCLKTPLYDEVETQDRNFLRALRSGKHQFDAYCTSCRKESFFRDTQNWGSGGTKKATDWMLEPGQFVVDVKCQRDAAHGYQFWFEYDGKVIRKCGQRPSLEDIAGADIRKYEKLLKGGYFDELKRATGLASHGIGIGSFVYLRRIFEKLIADHHKELPAPIEGFDGKRTDEKISALKDVLPPALVENKAAYAILSKGIHELDEISCRKYFPVVRQAIILILEQDLQRRQREADAKRLRDELAKIVIEVQGER